jgi:hypothetical protein
MDAATAGLIGSLGGIALAAVIQTLREGIARRQMRRDNLRTERRQAYANFVAAANEARVLFADVHSQLRSRAAAETVPASLQSQISQAERAFHAVEVAAFYVWMDGSEAVREELDSFLSAARKVGHAWLSNSGPDSAEWPSLKPLRDRIRAELAGS